MKKLFVLLMSVLGWLTLTDSQAQGRVIPNLGRLNFAVPDMPAFKVLGTEPSTILRPSTPQALATTVSQFYGDGRGILPRNIAVEVAPLLLLDANPHRRMELEKYLNRQWLHSLRISVGTLTDSANSPYVSKLGAGLRISLLNKGDLRYDRNFLSEVAEELKDDALRVEAFRKQFLAIHPLGTLSPEKDSLLFDEFLKNKQLVAIEEKIETIKEAYKRANWNAQKLDVAIAWAGRSPDSLVGNLSFHRLTAWATWAIPVRQWGQFLIGLNYDGSRNVIETREESLTRFSLSTRLYAGTNRFKGYLEGQSTWLGRWPDRDLSRVNSTTLFLHLGGEYGLLDGVWIQGYAGVQRDVTLQRSAFTGHLDLRFTIPERIKF